MSSHYTPGSGNGATGNSGAFSHRREFRAGNGAHASMQPGAGRGYASTFDFEAMIADLHALFEKDRQIASQQDSARCGICYLYHHLSELHYKDEGFYICKECERALGKQRMPMLRKQQK